MPEICKNDFYDKKGVYLEQDDYGHFTHRIDIDCYYKSNNKININLVAEKIYNSILKLLDNNDYTASFQYYYYKFYYYNGIQIFRVQKTKIKKILFIKKQLNKIDICILDKILNDESNNFNIINLLRIGIFILHNKKLDNLCNSEYICKYLQLLYNIATILKNKEPEFFYDSECATFIVLLYHMSVLLYKIKNIKLIHKELFNDILLIVLDPILLTNISFLGIYQRNCVKKILGCLKYKTLTKTFMNKFLELNYHNTLEYQEYFNNKDITNYLFNSSKIKIKKYWNIKFIPEKYR